jgi:hypothetical protein
MTGPEHYKAAEQLLQPRTTHAIPSGEPRQSPPTTDMILQAQAHATLALAAATALQSPAGEDGGMHIADTRAWEAVCSAVGGAASGDDA